MNPWLAASLGFLAGSLYGSFMIAWFNCRDHRKETRS